MVLIKSKSDVLQTTRQSTSPSSPVLRETTFASKVRPFCNDFVFNAQVLHVGQVKGDGDPTCFTKVDDTGIPALQEWCHKLTVSSRSRAARNFLTHLNTFAKNVRVFLQGIGEVTEADRLAMRDQWESFAPDEDDRFGIASSDGPWSDYGDLEHDRLYTLPQTKIGPDGEPTGVAPRLRKVSCSPHHLGNYSPTALDLNRILKLLSTIVSKSFKSGSKTGSRRSAKSVQPM